MFLNTGDKNIEPLSLIPQCYVYFFAVSYLFTILISRDFFFQISVALNQLNRSSGPISFGYAELENNNAAQASILTDFASQTTPGIDKSGLSLKTELKSSSPNKPPAASPTKRKIFFPTRSIWDTL